MPNFVIFEVFIESKHVRVVVSAPHRWPTIHQRDQHKTQHVSERSSFRSISRPNNSPAHHCPALSHKQSGALVVMDV